MFPSFLSFSSSSFYSSNYDDGTFFGIEQMIRPIFIFICCLLLLHLPSVLYKAKLWMNAVLYLILCNDKSWKKPIDPGSIIGPHLSAGNTLDRKTIFFVRHGESTWNDTFNKGHHRSAIQFAIGFIPGLIYSTLYETFLLLTGKLDSWFIDSPISTLGISQIEELANFLEQSKTKVTHKDPLEKQYLAILRGDPDAPSSKIVSSSLRRAVATVAIGFRDRLGSGGNDDSDSSNKKMEKQNSNSSNGELASTDGDIISDKKQKEKIMVLPSLQEISRNPDTLSITPALTTIQASWVENNWSSSSSSSNSKSSEQNSGGIPFQKIYNNHFDMSYHHGNKPFNTNGYKRMLEFCHTVFNNNTNTTNNNNTTNTSTSNLLPIIDEDYIIVGGHSIWFRSFFQSFLPYSSNHVSKTRKIVNGGIVVFELVKADTEKFGIQYMIDPKTIQVIYGGF